MIVRLPDFETIDTRRWLGCQRYESAAFTLQEIITVPIFVGGWGDPKAILRPEGLCQWKIPKIPPEIELATSRLVAKCPNQLKHRVPPMKQGSLIIRPSCGGAVSDQLLTAGARFQYQVVPLRIWRDQNGRRTCFLRLLRKSLSILILPLLRIYLSISWGRPLLHPSYMVYP